MILQVNYSTNQRDNSKINAILSAMGDRACKVLDTFWLLNVTGTLADWYLHIKNEAQVDPLDNLFLTDVSGSLNQVAGQLNPGTRKTYETWRTNNGLGQL